MILFYPLLVQLRGRTKELFCLYLRTNYHQSKFTSGNQSIGQQNVYWPRGSSSFHLSL